MFNWLKKTTIHKTPEKIWMTKQRKFQSVVEDARVEKQQQHLVVIVAYFKDSFLELQQALTDKSIPCVPFTSGFSVAKQAVVWQDQRAVTTFGLHCTNWLLLVIKTRIDSVTKASDFHRLADDLTLQQGVELLLDQDH